LHLHFVIKICGHYSKLFPAGFGELHVSLTLSGSV
jgi:hypothetical protein